MGVKVHQAAWKYHRAEVKMQHPWGELNLQLLVCGSGVELHGKLFRNLWEWTRSRGGVGFWQNKWSTNQCKGPLSTPKVSYSRGENPAPLRGFEPPAPSLWDICCIRSCSGRWSTYWLVSVDTSPALFVPCLRPVVEVVCSLCMRQAWGFQWKWFEAGLAVVVEVCVGESGLGQDQPLLLKSVLVKVV